MVGFRETDRVFVPFGYNVYIAFWEGHYAAEKLGCEVVVGRADELRKIRGVLFTPVSVEELLRREFPEINEYEIIVERKGAMDEATLRVEPKGDLTASALEELTSRISERLKIKTNLRFSVTSVRLGELPRYTLKSKRFKDLREA